MKPLDIFQVEPGEPLARFSQCKQYRYELWRRWKPGPFVMFLLLNPSTADDKKLDPTLRRCLGYAQDWGYSAMCITNLFPYRATDPRDMKRHYADPNDLTGDRGRAEAVNRITIANVAMKAAIVVGGWGTHGSFLLEDMVIVDLLSRYGVAIHCLAKCANGAPVHPLYQKRGISPTLWAK